MILVFGSNGQVATELACRETRAIFLSRDEANLLDPSTAAAAILRLRPEAVINAAAYTLVNLAEEEEIKATLTNGAAPGEIAKACRALDIPLVHLSTDYVFDGSGEEAFSTDSPAKPLGAYGRSKLAGEKAIRTNCSNYAILRTSWVFSAHGQNFVKAMLRLSETHNQLQVVADQVGAPTPAAEIAGACMAVAHQLIEDRQKVGTYHFAGAPNTSRADFAREIFRQAGRPVAVEGIPSSSYHTKAVRPANGRLDCGSLENFKLKRPDWKAGLAAVLKELEDNDRS